MIVFWQASNPSTGQSLPVYGWGLGYWPFDYANGMTYATVFNLSWVWPNDVCKGEVFLHEWLHGVTGFYMWRGYSFPFEDLHGAEEAGYVTDANGCWKNWLMDYMRGMVYEGGVRKALVPETWQGGSITTYDISGWRGEYFNNQILSSFPVLVRDDPDVNFEWLLGSPHPFILNDGFSGRWTRIINFEQGDYKFDLFRDDGMRLKIDGATVLENWQYGREWISLTKTMMAGPHTIQVEFYEIDGYASAVFQYAKLLPGKFNKLDPLDFSTIQMLIPTLHWNESTGAVSYEYCLDQGSADEICNSGWISTGINTFAVLQTPLSDGATYHWQVRARNEHGTIVADEDWWTFDIQLAAPYAPNNLVVKNTTSNSVTIGWDDTEYETGYKIYKWGPNSSRVWGFYYYTTLGQNVMTFTDINLSCNGSYWYELSAFNSHGESPHAGWVAANTLASGGGELTVSSIIRTSATPTNLASVNFTVTFSRSVTAIDIY